MFTHLDKRLDLFLVLGMMPGGTGVVFNALGEGLDSKLSEALWNALLTETQRNNKMDSILKTLGRKLGAVESKYYVEILGDQGPEAMKAIAQMLVNEF